MAEKYVVAFDLGTSSMKAILMDQNAKVHASKRSPLFPKYPKEGWAESDPVAWWDTACQISKEMIAECGIDPADICAVGFDAPSAGFIPMSKEKGALYPSIIWLDFRAEGIAVELNKKIAEETGQENVRIWSGKDGIPKILWVKKYFPEIWEEMDCFIPDTSYMVYRATGELVCSHQNAISYAFDGENMDWDFETFDAYGIERSKLPKIMAAVDVAGYLTEKAAEELGLPAGLPVTAGFSDCSSVELGGCCSLPGDTSIYIGTSMLFTHTTDDKRPSCATAYNFPSSHPGYNMFLITNDMSGGCIDWIIDKLFVPERSLLTMQECYNRVDRMLDETEPGANRLFFSTYFYGERQPVCDDYIRAGFWNLNPDHGRSHMVRAVYEGIAYEIRWALEKFKETHGLSYERLTIAGGGSRSDHLMQIVADVTNISIDVIEDGDYAIAKGTGYLSFIAAGVLTFEGIRELKRIKKSFEPRAEYREVYDNGSRSYQKYYETTKEFFKELNG